LGSSVRTLVVECSGIVHSVEELSERSVGHLARVKGDFEGFGMIGVSATYLAISWVIHIPTNVPYTSGNTIFLEVLDIQVFYTPLISKISVSVSFIYSFSHSVIDRICQLSPAGCLSIAMVGRSLTRNNQQHR
jgi:hypothetical protein